MARFYSNGLPATLEADVISLYWNRFFFSVGTAVVRQGETVQERVRTRAYYLYVDGCNDEKRNYFQAQWCVKNYKDMLCTAFDTGFLKIR